MQHPPAQGQDPGAMLRQYLWEQKLEQQKQEEMPVREKLEKEETVRVNIVSLKERARKHLPPKPVSSASTRAEVCDEPIKHESDLAHFKCPPLPLPCDAQGRPYLRIANSWDDTWRLMDMMVERFFLLAGAYPAEILLSRLRYLCIGEGRSFYTRNGKASIPIHCEIADQNPNDPLRDLYEVMVRGEPGEGGSCDLK